ncbi:MAG: hypothetical protein M1495_13195 [Bacteroidetes bacterium]|nr:hypothetical protein [Bacteroidota bacterium]MCL6096971.1 hypothetical protein [Bacteroidota bacterium]
MKFARWIFIIAGVYGIIAITPLYFSEAQMNIDFPPAITHPEYFYGFLGVAISWQILFFILAINPLRYKLMIIPAIIEKFSYGIAVAFLFSQHRIHTMILSSGIMDLIFGILFMVAFLKVKPESPQENLSN